MENKIAENERLIQDIEISPKTWLKVGAGLKNELGEDGFKVWEKWAQKSYPDSDLKEDWALLRPDRVSKKDLIALAENSQKRATHELFEEDKAQKYSSDKKFEKMSTQKADELLSYIDSTPRDTWLKVGAGLKNEFGDEGFIMWDRWSSKAKNYDQKVMRGQWASLKTDRIHIGTVVYLAKEGGWQPEKREKVDLKLHNIWKSSKSVASDHPYLKDKNIQDPEILSQIRERTIKDGEKEVRCLVVPLKNRNGELSSLQFINENGDKRFTANRPVSGNFLLIGDRKEASEHVFLAEGLATASSIHRATGKPVVVAFNANNLPHVADVLEKEKFSKSYTIAADNDLNQKGITKAAEAQKILSNASVALPQFSIQDGEKFYQEKKVVPTDFNDLEKISGLAQVKETLSQPIQTSEFLVKKTEQVLSR